MTRSYIKKLIKRLLSRPLYSSVRRIREAIDGAEVVSFDIFDTLVKRDVQTPEQIHEIVRQKYLRRHAAVPEDYPRRRIQAEILARKNSNNEEVTLKEVFGCLDICSSAVKEELYAIEIETELEMSCPNYEMSRLYRYAQLQGKRIVITSDMYLPECVIKNILEKCDISGYARLYLSSSFLKNKRTGHIFDVIKSDFHVPAGKILHIGDNLLGDHMVPLRKGLKCCLINGERNVLRYWKRPKSGPGPIEKSWLYAFLNNRISSVKEQGDAAVIGYEVLGPLLLGFTQWLHKRAREDGIEKLFFLSREGKLLQEAYNIMHAEQSLPQDYLYVSRRALLVPLVSHAKTYDDLIELMKVFMHAPQLETVGEICLLDRDGFAKGLNDLGLDVKTPVYAVKEDMRPAVYALIMDLGKDRYLRQSDLVSRYLDRNGFGGSVGIVDVGWSGTMQKCLASFSQGTDVPLRGYYMGVRNLERDSAYSGMRRFGYLFSPGENADIDQQIRFTAELFETLFLDTEGSVIAYKETEAGEILPIQGDMECGEKERAFVQEAHRAALSFLNDVKSCGYVDGDEQLAPEAAFRGYVSFGVRPSMQTVDLFRDFVFIDGTIRHTVAPTHSLFYYILRPRRFAGDLETCCNKVFFLKKIFKLDIPYAGLLKLLADKGAASQYRKHFVNERKAET